MLYPDNKKFAFTILDDTDDATRENVEPIYRYLKESGFRTTKTVWPLSKDEQQQSLFDGSSDLSNPDYLDFIKWLASENFEVTWHGPAMESSNREKIINGMDAFEKYLGFSPSLHVNHSHNKDNMYWGLDRFNNPFVKFILKLTSAYKENTFQGQSKDSMYFWGDIATQHFKYCRSFTFENLNILNTNPSIPYVDPKRPEFNYWFSTCDADSVFQFEERFTKKNMLKLINEQGTCILSTHFGKGYCKNGQVKDSVKRVLDFLASHEGWFVPVSEMLNKRLQSDYGKELSTTERTTMELRWLYESILYKTKTQFTNK